MLKHIILTLLAAILTGMAANAGNVPDSTFAAAEQAYVVGDYQRAFELFKQSADAGNMEAMHNVAVMLIQPLGCVQNVPLALEYYKKASTLGYNPSTYNLGHMHYNGNLNGKVNKSLAAQFFRKAADNGHSESAHYLGIMYQQGDGVTKDSALAAKYLRVAAKTIPLSQQCLGMLLTSESDNIEERREGVANLEKSRLRLTSPYVDFAIALEYDVHGCMPTDFLKAVQYYKSPADNGNVYAMRRFAVLHLGGGMQQANPVLGVRYLKRAADAGDLPSKVVYAYLLRTGKFLPKNKNLALRMYREAYDAGERELSWRGLMKSLFDKTVNGYNPEKGLEVVKEMAYAGNPEAKKMLDETLEQVKEEMPELNDYVEMVRIPESVRKNNKLIDTEL